MSNTPHGLAEEFPADADKIQALKGSDAHFAKIAEEYQRVNDQIHRAETQVEPMSDDHETELRKKRLALKDEIAAMLRAAV
ncbi:YdcH family protein [Pararhodobacter marinus]|uniref:DUF465 domain-containing protein n=1 Tax=Pararhodobacter marinus TaxID=2184063 RepID=A0A2U2C8L0_9RHOB|nr:YdcH family protein [Pararhodobacter marinus]PWE28203.1 hypothetical protein C4N9_12720 [Pararhodobacter marinus]